MIAGLKSSARRSGGPRDGRSAIRILAGGLFCTMVTGCAFVLPSRMAFPDEPIAFLQWTNNDAKKRAELFERVADLSPLPPSRFDPDRQRENEIRAHLRAEKTLPLQRRLAKTPGRLMLIWPRSGEVKRLEAAPVGSHPLAWSSDHKRLLFASGHRGGKEQLYEYHVERKVLRQVTVGPEEHPRGDYDRAGNGIVVNRLSRRASQGASRQTIHLLGTGGRLGSAIAEGVPPGTIRISRDGDHLIYEQVESRSRGVGPGAFESTIATRSISDRGEEHRLGRGREPTLTPDGMWIVFASRSSAGYRLRRMRPDGTSKVAISPGGSEERMPSVSPDGEFVVFVQMNDGRRILTVRRFDGKGERRLVSDGWSEFPVW